jgi:hypothetical protein
MENFDASIGVRSRKRKREPEKWKEMLLSHVEINGKAIAAKWAR